MEFFAAQINTCVGDVQKNANKAKEALKEAKAQGAEGVLFPELALTGYPPEDLLYDASLLLASEKALEDLLESTRGLFVAIGLPRRDKGRLYNSAAVCIEGKCAGFYDKQLLPTYNVFDERRYFSPGKGENMAWDFRGKRIGVTICEDAWQGSPFLPLHVPYDRDPLEHLGEVDLLINLSASPFYEGKRAEREAVFRKVALRVRSPVLVCNQVGANDALIFDGESFLLSAEGEVRGRAAAFREEIGSLLGEKRPLPEVEMLYQALVLGVRDYFHKQGFTKAVLGLSGGVDSAVVAAIGREALGKEAVCLLALPSQFTSQESRVDAEEIAKRLDLPLQELPIDGLFSRFLEELRPRFEGKLCSLVEENLQARIRGTLLMAYANQTGALLLNTSNKSEAAMGYTTLYGDLCGSLAVLLDVLKTRVYALARFLHEEKGLLPLSVLTKAPSAELKAGQKDTDTLPPYEELDPLLEEILSDSLEAVSFAQKHGEKGRKVLRAVFSSEYKRRQAPLGLCVTKKSFAKGRFFPIVQKVFSLLK